VTHPGAKTPAEIDQGSRSRYTRRFYRDVLTLLERDGIPVLVGGAFAFTHFTHIQRPTRDFDLFLKRQDVDAALDVLHHAGFATELPFPHWLAKARSDEFLVDLIFSSGNGVAPVDDIWFDHAIPTEVFGVQVKLCPAEELIWSKAFVMERERYDGADVVHLIRASHATMDWNRVLARFGPLWRVLFFNLVLYNFVYPSEPCPAPRWLMCELLDRVRRELDDPASSDRLCQGTLVSRAQYLTDIMHWGYADARLMPRGTMTAEEIERWTDAINK
jgi:hypothetical protein